MILSYEVGDRSGATAIEFMDDGNARSAGEPRKSTDHGRLQGISGSRRGRSRGRCGLRAANQAVRRARTGQIDGHERKYSPSECTGTRKRRVEGNPDPAHVSTSYVERQRPTCSGAAAPRSWRSMRMGMPRFTRLTPTHSARRLRTFLLMLSLYFVHYNFVRIHKTLKCTPAMASGVSETLVHDMGPLDPQRWPDPSDARAAIYGMPNSDQRPTSVRHQRFWFQRPRKLGEYLTHLVDSIMRRVCGVASAGFQVFCV